MKKLVLVALGLALFAGRAGGAPPGISAGGILFSSTRAADLWGEIYVRSPNGGPPRDLSRSPADDRGAVLSPDGRTIAFISDRTGHDAVWTMTTSGRRLRRVSRAYPHIATLAWLPSGRSLLVQRGPQYDPGGLSSLDLRSRSVATVASNVLSFAISPDGSRIATSELACPNARAKQQGRCSFEVAIRDAGGRVVRRVDGTGPAWSARNELVVSGPKAGFAVYDASGRLQRTHAGALPRWSPDGLSLAFTRGNAIWLLSGSDERKLVSTSQRDPEYTFAWTPDSKGLVYSAYNGSPTPTVRLVPLHGTQRPLHWPYVYPDLAWSHDGTRALIPDGLSVARIDGSSHSLGVGRLAGSSCEPGFESFGWLPHDDAFIYVRTYDGYNDADLWTTSATPGARPKLLVGTPDWETDARWSPEGRRVAYTQDQVLSDGGQPCGPLPSGPVAVLDPDRQSSGAITEPGDLGDSAPAWSPDGKQIAFARNSIALPAPQNAIEVVPVAGGTGRRLTTYERGRPYAGEIVSRPAWSPDGRRIAYDQGVLHVIEGTTDRTLDVAGAAPAWSPDGRWIAFQGSGLSIVSSSGGKAQQLSKAGGRDAPVWSPDGKHVATAGQSGVVVATPTPGSGRVIVKRPALHVAWSPDGQRLVFAAWDGGHGNRTEVGQTSGSAGCCTTDLYVVNADGTHLRRLTHDRALITSVDWRR